MTMNLNSPLIAMYCSRMRPTEKCGSFHTDPLSDSCRSMPASNKFQLGPAVQNALQRYFQIRLEEKGEIGQRGEIIKTAHPFGRAAAHDVARERRENITVAQYDIAGAQEREQMPFVAVGKSVAWIRLNVVGVSNSRFLPLLVADFTSSEEFHSLK